MGEAIQKSTHSFTYSDIFRCINPEKINILVDLKPTFIIKTNHQNIPITKRETETLLYLICGYSANDAANKMEISARTVESHIVNIKNKTGCNRLAELVHMALCGEFLENFI